MSLPVPEFIQSSPWPGVYPGDGVPGMTVDGWIEAFCALYLDSGKHLQDWDAWRAERLSMNAAQIASLDRPVGPMDASVA